MVRRGHVHGEAEYSGVVLDGRYRVQRRLGQGGMGTVYAAEHVGLGQRRAIKFLRPEIGHKPGAIRRFLQEARVLSGLHNEHLVTVLDMGEYAGTAYYVMELLDGEDLRGRLRRLGAMSWADVRTVALQVCDALIVTHARGIIHRDLKPENCFCLNQPGTAIKIKLIDFGVAKVPKEAGGTSQLTGTGEALGTVGYMAPEQMEGQGDQRVDVYSLGAMIFELLAGRPLYRGNAYEVISKMLLGTPPLLRQVCPESAPEIEALITRAIDRDPARRFTTMTEFAAAIAAIPADAPPTRGAERQVTEATNVLAVDGEASTFRPGGSPRTGPGQAIDGEATTLGAGSDVGLASTGLSPPTPPPREPPATLRVAPDPVNAAPAPRRRGWLIAAAALTVALGLPPLLRREPASVAVEQALPGPPPPPRPEPPAPEPARPAADAPATLPEPPPDPPPATPAPAVLKPSSAPAEVRLGRDQLKRRIDRELRTCKPDLLDETVTIRVTPGKAGAIEGLAPAGDTRLAPGIADCVERGLSRVVQTSKEPLAVKKSFDLTVVLRKGP